MLRLVGSVESSYYCETYLVEAVGQLVDSIGKVVVEDYSEGGSCDTGCGIDKGLRNTLRKGCGVTTTTSGQSGE